MGLFNDLPNTPEIEPAIEIDVSESRLNDAAAQSLKWIELLSGRFFEEHKSRFPQEKRAEQALLNNLKAVREELRETDLGENYIHDLLARIIFVQFLFDRKDSAGRSALNFDVLERLNKEGVLSSKYSNLAEILANYTDAYALFRWLDARFNGDLFPGSVDDDPETVDYAWQEEMRNIKPPHLEKLSDFVRGDIVLKNGQKSLWPMYSFDTIPLEFISSVYEEFVSRDSGVGVHYTPAYLVDLMLDRVLPWDSDNWDVKILDPSCGSGIFLVKAYQRLIYRWKRANRQLEVTAAVLRDLLENNIFGVDADANAVRVASFSMYLAMCDEIDPRYYWINPDIVFFPKLRDRRLVAADFFDDNINGLRAPETGGEYDLVVGNPPWGDKTISVIAQEWARKYGWRAANKDFGVLFAVKAAYLAKENGLICLVQSASAVLYNQESTAKALRDRLFQQFRKLEGIINFGAFRLTAFRVFSRVRVPSCVVIIRNQAPDGSAFLYECPKPLRTAEDIYRLVINAHDTHWLYPNDVLNEPWIWSVLMWGVEIGI